MLREILPEFGPLRRTSAWINLVSPAGLSVEGLRPLNIALFGGSLPQVPGGKWYGTDDEAVAFLGTGWRNRRIASLPEVDLMMSSQWLFSDEEAERMVSEVYKEYTKLFRQDPLSGARISLAKFPRDVKPGDWEAETRGNNVTIISSDMPFKTQSLQRLHEQLRHELFHLWIPNGVNLTGNYDWFYEGFALYQSLKLAVALNRIRFEDFLDTLSRAHTIDNAQSQRISLIQASTNRFGGSNTQVYARGMLVAFLTDLTMLERSKGKRSVEDLLKDLYVKHRKPTEPTDGNRAVTEMLKTRADAGSIVEKYIAGAQKIDWTNELGAVGIEDSDPGPLTSLRVKEKLNGGQKAILDKLGYNNWRKLSVPSK
jgi:predicted metalloprotease with PDZ domain